MLKHRTGKWTSSRWLATALLAPVGFGAGILAVPLQAHHSFAVHYDSNLTITQEGVVVEFRFTNPHGILLLDVTTEDGTVERWTAETSAPVYMRRFGWTPDMVKPGDHIVIDGYAARDGSHLMRIQTLKHPDGTPIGGRLQAGDQ
jgi:Family of unknown function (DUF6152)